MKNTVMTVSSKGQITLPKIARDKLGLKPGSKLHLNQLTNDIISLQREYTVDDFFGKFPDLWDYQDPVKLIREIRDSDRT